MSLWRRRLRGLAKLAAAAAAAGAAAWGPRGSDFHPFAIVFP